MFRKTKVCSGLMLAFGGSLMVSAVPAAAQQQLERVEITGSSIRRINAETALPVTVIKVEELTKQGVSTTEQLIGYVAANQSNFGASSAIGGTTGGKAEADLRGLSGPTNSYANKTLVLLNGRRLANHAFDAAAVDLNAIPLAAIDRVEVLRDGASSLYGTDAIGGVINFITKRDYVGFDISVQGQQPQASGGGDVQRLSLSGGFGSLTENRFNVQASLDWRKQSALMAADREFSKTGIIRGAVNAGTSGTSFPGDVTANQTTFEPSLPNCDPPGSVPNPTGTGCRYDFSRDVDILTKNEQITGLIRGSFAITPEHTLSLEHLTAKNKSTARVAAAPTSTIIPASSPFYPAGAPVGLVPDNNNPGAPDDTTACGYTNCVPGGVANWRQIPAGKRTSGDDTTTDRTLLELQGLMVGWDYRTGLGTTRNKSTADVKRGYVNDGIIAQGVWDGLINPFGAQTAAGQAAIEAAQVVAPTQVGKNQVDFFDFRVSKPDVFQLPAGPVGMAFGAEYRKEKSGFEALPITAQLGSLGIDPDGDTSGSRKVGAAFAEFNIPVIKDMEVTLAGRYDKYSDFGDTFNPKLGIRYQPTKEILLRGSANTGFRAPTLYEIYAPRALTFTTDPYNDPLLCPNGPPATGGASEGVVCEQQVMQQLAGPVAYGKSASDLQPEKSKSFSFGTLIEATPDLTFGIDFWNIQIKNLISPVPEQSVFENPTKYASRFVRCSQIPATGAGASRDDIDACTGYPGIGFDPIAYIDTPNENLGELKTYGLDLSAEWRSAPTPYGRFGLRMDGTYVMSYKYQREKDGEFFDAVGNYSDNAPVFRWQHVLAGTWHMDTWSATLINRYKSGYTDQDEVNKVGGYSLFDASVSWTGVKGFTLTGGIANLFDTDPPLSGQSTTFQRGYDPRFTNPLGRTFILTASYKY